MGRRDTGLALLVALVWGVNFLAIDRGLSHFPPLLFLALRFGLTSLITGLLFIRRIPPRLPLLLAVGLCGYCGQFALIFVAIHLGAPPGLTSLALQCQVGFTLALGALVLGERPGAAPIGGVALAAAGVLVLALGRGSAVPLLPLALVVLGGGLWALANVLTRLARPDDPMEVLAWGSLVVPLPVLALSFVWEGPAEDLRALLSFDGGAVLSLLFIVGAATLFGYGTWASLLRRNRADRVAPYTLLVPIAGVLAAWAVLGERPGPSEWLGGTLLLAGMGAATLPGPIEMWIRARRSRVRPGIAAQDLQPFGR